MTKFKFPGKDSFTAKNHHILLWDGTEPMFAVASDNKYIPVWKYGKYEKYSSGSFSVRNKRDYSTRIGWHCSYMEYEELEELQQKYADACERLREPVETCWDCKFCATFDCERYGCGTYGYGDAVYDNNSVPCFEATGWL